jgi:hypothetical protein
VQTVRPDLSDVQCRAVLRECGRREDAETGINWMSSALLRTTCFPQAVNNPRKLRMSALVAWESAELATVPIADFIYRIEIIDALEHFKQRC